MARRRSYWYRDPYKPPDFQSGDLVRFRDCRTPSRQSGGTVLIWEIIEVGVIYQCSDGWVRVRSTRTGMTRPARPHRLRMVESAGERVAKALMGGGA